MTDVTSNDSVMLDPQLAAALSRLAGLLGQAVPAHRFGMMAQTPDGVEVSSLSRVERLKAWWLGRFPMARIHSAKADKLNATDFPLLWLSDDGERVLLVRGGAGRASLTCQDADGASHMLEMAQARQGQFLQLTCDPARPGESAHKAMSATDWFATSIRRYRSVFFEAVIATFVISMVGLVAALYSMQVYDRVIPTKGYSTLWVLTIGVGIAILIELVLKQVRAYMVDRACKVIDQELSAVFFGKALDIRMDARPSTVGTFASQIRHFESVRNFLTSSSLFIMADLPFAVVFVGVIAIIAGPVALVPLVSVPLAVMAGLAFRGPIEKYTGQHMKESNEKNGLLIEAIDGIESVKAANAEWKMLERWRAMTVAIAGNELKMRLFSTLSSNLTQTIQQLSYAGMIAAGAYAINSGALTMGGLIACSIISGRALTPVAQLPGLIVQWQHAKIALKSLNGIMAMPSDRDPNERLVVPESCLGEIKMNKASFAYAKDLPGLEVPQLLVQPGERIAILGSVGSGKTTLVKLLSGLYKPTSGHVYLDGVDMMHLAPEFVREHVGYLPQDVRLFNGTLRHNLTLGLPLPSDSQIFKAAAMTGLDQVIQNHPKGLELEIAEGGRGLSGGQRQLVGLTRMLLATPKVLLLDEPTASMDAKLENRVMQHLFENMPKSSAIVVVTHKPSVLSYVSRIVVVDKGRVVLDGPRDEVLNRLRQPVVPTAPPANPMALNPQAPTAGALA
jgi:ATP-binding cassette subfamily C protein LapB